MLREVAGRAVVAGLEFDAARIGYVEQEYNLAGAATGYALAAEPSDDGVWTVRAVGESPFTTRVVVYRPANGRRFSGNVFLEWMNVSTGADAMPAWRDLHMEGARGGDVWAAVSVQPTGVHGGMQLMPRSTGRAVNLQAIDGERYGALQIPAEEYAFDMFRATARAIRNGLMVNGGRAVNRVFAVGTSQSASYLVTYINVFGRSAAEFDGYLVHKWMAGTAAPIEGVGLDAHGRRKFISDSPVQIRDDGHAKVIVVQPEGDALPMNLGLRSYRQADSEDLRLWQVAGAAHASSFTEFTAKDDGSQSNTSMLNAVIPTKSFAGYGASVDVTCPEYINNGPQTEYVSSAALRWLRTWGAGGPAPPIGDRFRYPPGGVAEPIRDQFGIVRGGVRSPWVDAPIAAIGGRGTVNDHDPFCQVFGFTRPFDRATLRRLYPGGAAHYERRFRASLELMERDGFILPEDARRAIEVAVMSYPADDA